MADWANCHIMIARSITSMWRTPHHPLDIVIQFTSKNAKDMPICRIMPAARWLLCMSGTSLSYQESRASLSVWYPYTFVSHLPRFTTSLGISRNLSASLKDEKLKSSLGDDTVFHYFHQCHFSFTECEFSLDFTSDISMNTLPALSRSSTSSHLRRSWQIKQKIGRESS